jgi:hypothetical protein
MHRNEFEHVPANKVGRKEWIENFLLQCQKLFFKHRMMNDPTLLELLIEGFDKMMKILRSIIA